ncbi:MAG TPA: ferritin-like domain-containing protein [Candidatus Eisenbacteria bacterium]|jgi:ferritin-like metal-binding protein YciE|nr:ferritin-like domain-containing protein [Candidatus Eisenbacteria bacterium]
MQVDSLEKLYVDQLRDIYDAENQLVRALPKMAKAASSPELRTAFEDHLEKTRGHVRRLDEIFRTLGHPSKGKSCKAMIGLIEEGDEMVKSDSEPSVKDAGLIAAAQKVEHYEIASYGTLRTFAEFRGDRQAAQSLQETLDEEYEADKTLTQVAEAHINVQAADRGPERR